MDMTMVSFVSGGKTHVLYDCYWYSAMWLAHKVYFGLYQSFLKIKTRSGTPLGTQYNSRTCVSCCESLVVSRSSNYHTGSRETPLTMYCSCSCFLSLKRAVGHGKSEGIRLHVESVETYVLDVIQHVEYMRRQNADLPSLILGHSMVSRTFVQLANHDHSI